MELTITLYFAMGNLIESPIVKINTKNNENLILHILTVLKKVSQRVIYNCSFNFYL